MSTCRHSWSAGSPAGWRTSRPTVLAWGPSVKVMSVFRDCKSWRSEVEAGGEAVAFLAASSLYWPGLQGTSELSSASARAQFSTLREILAAAGGLGALGPPGPSTLSGGGWASPRSRAVCSAYRVLIHVCVYVYRRVCVYLCVLEGTCGGQRACVEVSSLHVGPRDQLQIDHQVCQPAPLPSEPSH